MHSPIKTAVMIVILSGAAVFCRSQEEFSMKYNLADKPGGQFIGLKAGGIEIQKNAGDSGVLFQSTPAGKFAFSAGFSGIKMRTRPEALLVLDDEKDIKTFEHSFSCEDNGLKLEWVNVFKCHRDIPGVMIESRLINLAREPASCYQYWTSSSIKESYFTGTEKMEVPAGSVASLISSDSWVFFQINEKGGVGMILAEVSKDWMLFSSFRNEKGLWGIRTTTQGKSVFKKGEGSVLRFVLFFAVSPEKARELCDKIKKENIFPELRSKDAH